MSHIKTDKLSPRTGSGTVTLGTSGDTFSIPSGVTLTNSGTASGFGVSNDCVFVKISANQSLPANTVTKVQFDSEIYDSNNWFDSTTNYRFQPDVAGNYLCYTNIYISNAYHANPNFAILFYKNGSEFLGASTDHRYDELFSQNFSAIINLNGSTDYVEVYAKFEAHTVTITASALQTTSSTATNASFVRLT
jgi:hypothetical protein